MEKQLEEMHQSREMVFMINNKRKLEKQFWNSVNCMASENQICQLLDGQSVFIGETKYQILF